MRWFKGILVTLVLLAGFGVVGYYYIDYTLESPKRTKEITIEIPEATSLKEIGKILEQKHLIRKGTFFRYYAKYRHKTNLIAGTYVIQTTDNLDEIINKIASGKQDLVKIDIPTGFNVQKIAARLENSALKIRKEDFFKEVNRTQPRTQIEKQIPTKQGRAYKLEGYLMPASYEFRKGMTAQQVVDQMLKEFEKKIAKLDYQNKLKEKKMTMDEWITRASLLEKEAGVDKEYPIIAGVIENRLAQGKLLEIDAAIVYAWSLQGIKKDLLSNKDLEIKSPYNIYKNKGLPIGPIASPGVKAMLGVLNPQSSKYIYYVAKNDGTSEHYFTNSYDEFLKYKKLSKQNASQ